jgi:hypothetical protein
VLLESLPEFPAEEIGQRVEELRVRIGGVRSEAQALLREKLEDPSMAAHHYQVYLHYNRILLSCEHFDLPVIQRWGEDDRQITEMCWSLLDQVGWTFEHPHVSAFSNDYYWALPPRNIIGVPANEHERLLGIGDLAHELGHLVVASEETVLVLVRDTLERVNEHVRRAAAAPPIGLANPDEFFTEMNTCWREWVQELICDAFATYLTGPAYALQNLRLCCMRKLLAGVFQIPYREEHPSDDARMQVALHVLRALQLEGDAASVDERWQEMLDVVGVVPDDEYTIVYPDELLRVTAYNVHAGCQELGLRAYDPEITRDCDVARLANVAWEQLLAQPESYAEWETQATARCRALWSASPAAPVAS